MALTLTFVLLVPQRFNASPLHAFWRITARTGSFYGVFVQVFRQPSQVAIADEGVPCQVSEIEEEIIDSFLS